MLGVDNTTRHEKNFPQKIDHFDILNMAKISTAKDQTFILLKLKILHFHV